MNPLQILLQQFAAPADAVGHPGFPKQMEQLFDGVLPHDMRWSIVYSATMAPKVLGHSMPQGSLGVVDHDLIRRTYDAGYFRFDPFYRFWRDERQGGVFRLSDISNMDQGDAAYLSGFVPMTKFEDDVALICPIDTDTAVALTLERCRVFSTQEMAVLKAGYAPLAALVRSHWRMTGPQAKSPAPQAGLPPLTYPEATAGFLPGALTPKEREIVHLSFAGFDNRAIAQRLGVTIGTVKNHKKRLYAKVDVTSERELFSLFLGYLMGVEPSELGA
ncbi:transcriptional regulator NarL [Tritonibacter multivorans]|uniref:Transcriptional regulator NarL n=2 Tax=Tritonibacter multivorans TaxID=928856 RepID=A0A0P1H079_9RHOB|nr:transcriptional regulator NarL [Tritonibacter multivorans]SFD00056.1 regulatory protein, luxR family [Tritonibacter multivorans]